MRKNYFYWIHRDEENSFLNAWTLSDIECCAASKNTIDIHFNDFALNMHLLKLPGAYYFGTHCENGLDRRKYSDRERTDFQIHYFSAFFRGEEYNYIKDKLFENPVVRLLVPYNKELLKKCKDILTMAIPTPVPVPVENLPLINIDGNYKGHPRNKHIKK